MCDDNVTSFIYADLLQRCRTDRAFFVGAGRAASSADCRAMGDRANFVAGDAVVCRGRGVAGVALVEI